MPRNPRSPTPDPGHPLLQQFADRMFDDVVHDVGRRVIDAAGLFDLGLLLDDGPMAFGQANHLAEELLVDLPEDVGGKHGKLVWAIGVVEAFDDVLEDGVIDVQAGREFVGCVGALLFLLEVEQAGVVAIVGAAKDGQQTVVDLGAVDLAAELGVGLDAAILAHAQEDQAVDGLADGVVQITDRQAGVSQGDVAGQQFAPAFDLLEELGVDLGGAAFAAAGLGILVEGALEDGLLGEDVADFAPAVGVLIEGEVLDAGGGGLVGGTGADATVVNGELFEVGDDRQGQLGAPGIAAKLIGGAGVVLDGDRGLLGLDEELADAADAKAVVRGLGRAADLDGVFVDDVLVGFGVACLVVDVSAECVEERVDELAADLGFVVGLLLVGLGVLGEALDELENTLWRWGRVGRRCLGHGAMIARTWRVGVFRRQESWRKRGALLVAGNCSGRSDVLGGGLAGEVFGGLGFGRVVARQGPRHQDLYAAIGAAAFIGVGLAEYGFVGAGRRGAQRL